MPNLIWTPRNGGHWIVTRGSMVREVLRDPSRFSSGVIVLPKEAGEKYDLLPTRLDPPEHGEIRAVANKVLNLREIRRIEDPIREIAIELIEPLVSRGSCDFSEDYAQQFPIRVRSEEHTSELQSLMRTSYAVFGLKKKQKNNQK